MTNGLALLAHCSVRQKLNLVISVQFSYVALYASLVMAKASVRPSEQNVRNA